MNVLSEIVAKKRERLAQTKQVVPLDRVGYAAFERRHDSAWPSLTRALRRDDINIIAEFKRRSPSKGVIRADADLQSVAQSYQAGGAVAMSVLTEEDYFDGSLDDLRTVKMCVDLPVLRKDFVVDDYQVYESAAVGADAVLLIVAVLTDRELETLRTVAEEELGMDALIEVHTSDEMKRAAGCGANLIGVNNRDLRTFEVSLETSVRLAAEAPPGVVLVSESGLRSAADLRMLRGHGYNGFLIGESLMRAERPDKALRDLRE